jgi:hypothetical protein
MTGDLLDFADKRSRPLNQLLCTSLTDFRFAIVSDISPKERAVQILS